MLRMFSNVAKSTQLKWKGVKLLCFLYPSSMTSWLGDWSNVHNRIITMVRYNIWEREKEYECTCLCLHLTSICLGKRITFLSPRGSEYYTPLAPWVGSGMGIWSKHTIKTRPNKNLELSQMGGTRDYTSLRLSGAILVIRRIETDLEWTQHKDTEETIFKRWRNRDRNRERRRRRRRKRRKKRGQVLIVSIEFQDSAISAVVTVTVLPLEYSVTESRFFFWTLLSYISVTSSSESYNTENVYEKAVFLIHKLLF